MFGFLKRRKPKFIRKYETTINTYQFIIELFEAGKVYSWGASDKFNPWHQYVSKNYETQEEAEADLQEFVQFIESQTYGNY